jgi:rhodanese-related sulfurtransferase
MANANLRMRPVAHRRAPTQLRAATAHGAAEPTAQLFRTLEWLQKYLDSPEPVQVLDARAPQQYQAGHIPTAQNLFLRDLLRSEGGYSVWRSPDEIRDTVRQLGIDPARPLVVYCNSGREASQAVVHPARAARHRGAGVRRLVGRVERTGITKREGAVNAFTRYLHALESALQAGDATESTHRPALKSLLESLQQGIVAVNEPKRIACGAPDFAVRRIDASGNGVNIGYLETKDIGAPLDAAEMTDQLQRYRANLPNLILTNYLEFRWYVDGARRQIARLAEWDARAKRLRRTPNGANELHALLQNFLAHTPTPIADADALARQMARYAHLIRDTISAAFQQNLASDILCDLRTTFAETLLPDLDQPDKLADFADMLAQTLVYGLFAARCYHTAETPFTRAAAAHEIPLTNPFLRGLFDTLTGAELDHEPFMPFVDDLVDAVGAGEYDTAS